MNIMNSSCNLEQTFAFKKRIQKFKLQRTKLQISASGELFGEKQ